MVVDKEPSWLIVIRLGWALPWTHAPLAVRTMTNVAPQIAAPNWWSLAELDTIFRKQHLPKIKARLLWLVEHVFSPIKTQQATSEASVATNELMEPRFDHMTLRPIIRSSQKLKYHGWKFSPLKQIIFLELDKQRPELFFSFRAAVVLWGRPP